jgi:hypothetical protein
MESIIKEEVQRWVENGTMFTNRGKRSGKSSAQAIDGPKRIRLSDQRGVAWITVFGL